MLVHASIDNMIHLDSSKLEHLLSISNSISNGWWIIDLNHPQWIIFICSRSASQYASWSGRMGRPIKLQSFHECSPTKAFMNWWIMDSHCRAKAQLSLFSTRWICGRCNNFARSNWNVCSTKNIEYSHLNFNSYAIDTKGGHNRSLSNSLN